MSIIGTCKCEKENIDDFEVVCTRAHDRQYRRALSYGTYCKKCIIDLELNGLILHNSTEKAEWLYNNSSEYSLQRVQRLDDAMSSYYDF